MASEGVQKSGVPVGSIDSLFTETNKDAYRSGRKTTLIQLGKTAGPAALITGALAAAAICTALFVGGVGGFIGAGALGVLGAAAFTYMAVKLVQAGMKVYDMKKQREEADAIKVSLEEVMEAMKADSVTEEGAEKALESLKKQGKLDEFVDMARGKAVDHLVAYFAKRPGECADLIVRKDHFIADIYGKFDPAQKLEVVEALEAARGDATGKEAYGYNKQIKRAVAEANADEFKFFLQEAQGRIEDGTVVSEMPNSDQVLIRMLKMDSRFNPTVAERSNDLERLKIVARSI